MLASSACEITVRDERLCDIVELTGVRFPIRQTAILSLRAEALQVEGFKFAVVPDNLFPHCFLFGLDFLNSFKISINFTQSICKSNNSQIALLVADDLLWKNPLIITTTRSPSHTLGIGVDEWDNVRVDLDGPADAVIGLVMLLDDNTICNLQSRSNEIRNVKNYVSKDTPSNKWKKAYRNFARYSTKLSIVNDVLVRIVPNPVMVVSFKILVNLAVLLHCKFVNVRQNKGLALINDLVWHPLK